MVFSLMWHLYLMSEVSGNFAKTVSNMLMLNGE